jgi:hypothetical protein
MRDRLSPSDNINALYLLSSSPSFLFLEAFLYRSSIFAA